MIFQGRWYLSDVDQWVRGSMPVLTYIRMMNLLIWSGSGCFLCAFVCVHGIQNSGKILACTVSVESLLLLYLPLFYNGIYLFYLYIPALITIFYAKDTRPLFCFILTLWSINLCTFVMYFLLYWYFLIYIIRNKIKCLYFE